METDDVEFCFPKPISGNHAFSNVDGIEIADINKHGLLKEGTLKVSAKPKNDKEIEIQLGIRNACTHKSEPDGVLNIKQYVEDQITGTLKLVYENDDKVIFDFSVPLINLRPKIPLPIRKMDGSVVDYMPISDEYPNDGLLYNQIILSGMVSGVVSQNTLLKGKANLKKNELEIEIFTATKLGKIEIDIKSKNNDMDSKLCIGTFQLKKQPKNPFSYLLASQATDELFVKWEDNVSGELSAKGYLTITAYAENGIAGKFEINIIGKDGGSSIVKSRFKLPLVIK